jgi:hypothetical protein
MDEEKWQEHVETIEEILQRLRRDEVDSRTLCGRLERGWVRWSPERRMQQRHLVRDLWEEGSAGVPRDRHAFFIGGNDSGEKLLRLANREFTLDPDDYFVVDAFWVEYSMTVRGMTPVIDGLSPMEASRLIREEACELSERLATLAYAEGCNLLYLLNTAYMTDAAAFMRIRSDPADIDLRYGPAPSEPAGTTRANIERYRRREVDFSALVENVLLRCRDRAPKPTVYASWQEVYNRAEQRHDDDDLYWISVAEDLGNLTAEEADKIFYAIESATNEQPAGGISAGRDAVSSWECLTDGDGSLIRVPPADGPSAKCERYWGARSGWVGLVPGCTDWAQEAAADPRYRAVDETEMRSIEEYLDHRPGGVFRRGAFWHDQADRWTVPQATRRLDDLKAATSDIVMYWTWQEYQGDLNEAARLVTFLEVAPGDISLTALIPLAASDGSMFPAMRSMMNSWMLPPRFGSRILTSGLHRTTSALVGIVEPPQCDGGLQHRLSFGIGIIPTMGASKSCVYVIELNDAVRNDKKFLAMNPDMKEDKLCVYVGSTGHDPDIRFAQHLEGYKSCKYVKKFGERLRPDLVPKYEKGFKNSREAEAAEARLAARLRKRGHGVWQN